MHKAGVVVSLIALVVFAFSGVASADRTDFAFFDGSNPANAPNAGAVCRARQGFTYHVTVANWGSAGEVRITYADGDFIRFPIAAGASFSMTQAAGRNDASRAVRVSNGGSAAQLAGSMSASTTEAPAPLCISCDADSSGDATCDEHVPN
jgi:hypothetical protein